MKISAKAEYACLALLELARPGKGDTPLRIREIAEAQEIPPRYLVQILLQLKASGLVRSTRGADGGYLLARPAEEIPVAEVIALIDGPGDPLQRLSSPASRALHMLLNRARDAEYLVLSGTTIAELVGTLDPPLDWVV